jgi:hypothetical protein
MKTVATHSVNPHSPSELVGPFVPFAYHQHYVRGHRSYDPTCVPSVEYAPPTVCDFWRAGAPVFNSFSAAVQALREKCSRRMLGRHGQRGIKRLVAADFPTDYCWVDTADGVTVTGWGSAEYATEGEWATQSQNSPYNQD